MGGGMGGMGGGGMGGMGGGGGMTTYQQYELSYLIMTTIEPDSWYGMAFGGQQTFTLGRGNLSYYADSLLVYQTPNVHQKITALLKKLRKTHGAQVAIEARLLTISSNFLEDIGLDVDFLINMDNAGFDSFSNITVNQDSYSYTEAPATSVPGSLGGGAVPSAFTLSGTFLDNVQVDFLMRATQAHARNRSLVAPHVTVYNGEMANVSFYTSTNYVASLESVVGYGVVGYNPQVAQNMSGISFYITPTISADKRFVLLNVLFTQQITRSFTDFVYASSAPAVESDQPIAGVPTTRIQLPVSDINSIMTHVAIPDGGTLLLGGQKLVGEAEEEAGVPTLSKIPILNRLFSNRSMVKDESVLLILIKPQIILQDEEEEDKFGSLLTTIE
ncbi:MAG: hypothetical protein JW860_06940, partial [Sedimentisphaerales bacterium]|nr:hypothetical protein [Sedimentisphaerales bacterium]